MGDGVRIDRAVAAGIDVIVIDHHQEGEEGAPKCIVINPNKKGDDYPNKCLCGAGVAYKVVQGVISTLRKQTTDDEQQTSPEGRSLKLEAIPVGWEKWLLDMVGIAT